MQLMVILQQRKVFYILLVSLKKCYTMLWTHTDNKLAEAGYTDVTG